MLLSGTFSRQRCVAGHAQSCLLALQGNRDQHPELMVDAGLCNTQIWNYRWPVVAISGNEERQLFVEKAEGFRAIDVGPLTMSYREDHSRTD